MPEAASFSIIFLRLRKTKSWLTGKVLQMKTISIAHPVNHAAYDQLRLRSLTSYLAHVFAAPYRRDRIHATLTRNYHWPPTSFETSPYASGNGFGKWWWEGITYLTVCLSLRKIANRRGSPRRATIRTVSLGMPTKSLAGALSAIPFPSTPKLAHASLALVGPRSGPPCFKEPPTIVGAISSAAVRHALAPSNRWQRLGRIERHPQSAANPQFLGQKCSRI